LTLDEAAPKSSARLCTSIPGPAIIPEVTILPHLHFKGDIKWILAGKAFNGRQGIFEMEPGVPMDLTVMIELLPDAPSGGLFILDMDPETIA